MSTPTHKRRQAVDQEIHRAVIHLLATRGFLNLRMLDVANEAGVNKTTLYRRHKTVESIVVAAITSYAEQEIPIPDTGSLLEDFKTLTRAVKALLESQLGRALVQATGSPSLIELRSRYWKGRLHRAASLIERASFRGECGPVPEPEMWIESLVAPIHFRVFQTKGSVSSEFLDAQALRVVEAIQRRYPSDSSLAPT